MQILVEIPLVVQELSGSQDFRSHRCVTLNFEPMTLKPHSACGPNVGSVRVRFDSKSIRHICVVWKRSHSPDYGHRWLTLTFDL